MRQKRVMWSNSQPLQPLLRLNNWLIINPKLICLGLVSKTFAAIPASIHTVTAELIADQHAKTLGDVVGGEGTMRPLGMAMHPLVTMQTL